MKKSISFIVFVAFAFLTSQLHAGWIFDNGTFKITGDTTIYVLPEDSSLYLHKFGYFLNDDPKFYKIDKDNINQALNFKDGDTAKHIVLSVLDSSATTSLAVKGSSPRSTHSTDA